MTTYKRLGNMTRSMLSTSRLGQNIEIVKTGVTSFNPATGVVETTSETINTTAVRVEFKRYYINNETVLDRDVNFYINSLDSEGEVVEEILTTDKLVFSGKSYIVVGTSDWNFNGEILGYKVHARATS